MSDQQIERLLKNEALTEAWRLILALPAPLPSCPHIILLFLATQAWRLILALPAPCPLPLAPCPFLLIKQQ